MTYFSNKSLKVEQLPTFVGEYFLKYLKICHAARPAHQFIGV